MLSLFWSDSWKHKPCSKANRILPNRDLLRNDPRELKLGIMDQVSLLFLLFQAFLQPGLLQNDPVEEASLMELSERRIPKIEQLSLLAAKVSQKKFKRFFILDSCLSA
jgi:hypothetical protein